MDKSELEEVICRAIVEYISDKVVEKLCSFQKRALVLFTGGSLGFKQSVESLNSLRDDGWELKYLMSQSAESVLTVDLLHRLCKTDDIITETDKVDLKALLREYEYLLIPELTVNTAAKVACGISDSLPTRVIAYAMAQGKRIIAATDGCCPDNPARAALGFHVTEAYKDKLRSNLEQIKSYGIHLTTAQKLADRVRREVPWQGGLAMPAMPKVKPAAAAVKEQISEKQLAPSVQQPRVDATANVKFGGNDKRVFGRSDAWLCRDLDEVHISRDVLVTPLAIDELSKWKVRLIRE